MDIITLLMAKSLAGGGSGGGGGEGGETSVIALDFIPVMNPPEGLPVYNNYGLVEKPINEIYQLMTENYVCLKTLMQGSGFSTNGVIYAPLSNATKRNNITQISGTQVVTNGDIVIVQSFESIPYGNKTYFGVKQISLNLS